MRDYEDAEVQSERFRDRECESSSSGTRPCKMSARQARICAASVFEAGQHRNGFCEKHYAVKENRYGEKEKGLQSWCAGRKTRYCRMGQHREEKIPFSGDHAIGVPDHQRQGICGWEWEVTEFHPGCLTAGLLWAIFQIDKKHRRRGIISVTRDMPLLSLTALSYKLLFLWWRRIKYNCFFHQQRYNIPLLFLWWRNKYNCFFL